MVEGRVSDSKDVVMADIVSADNFNRKLIRQEDDQDGKQTSNKQETSRMTRFRRQEFFFFS